MPTTGEHRPDLGLLHFRGSDASKFLQGQLSNDMAALGDSAVMLAGLHNPQGRVLALLRLVAPAADHIVAVLPADLVAATAATLRRYVLRAKVTIEEAADDAALAGLAAQLPAAAALLAPLLAPGAHARDIAAGVPQIYAATSGRFVAQMLNLDCIGAISFNKGCYTGQEIIARTHYRGRMKRRMQRFLSAAPLRLVPGESVVLADGRAAQLVDVLVHEDGSTEFLAVAPRPEEAGGELSEGQPLECRPLPLPYAFPD